MEDVQPPSPPRLKGGQNTGIGSSPARIMNVSTSSSRS